jgi:hypothetical protein
MKNLVTPAGIEPATFRFVARNLNHCATAVPPRLRNSGLKPGLQGICTEMIKYEVTDASVSAHTEQKLKL